MRKQIYFISIVVFFNILFSQKSNVIFKDSITNETLSDIQIIGNQNLTTFTNKNGEVLLDTGNYKIKHFNYFTKKVYITKDTLIYLEPANSIEEVVVLPRKLTNLIENISAAISENYPSKPFNTKGIVRYQLIKDDKLVLFKDIGFKSLNKGFEKNVLDPKNRFEVLASISSDDFSSERFRFITHTYNEVFNTVYKAVNLNVENKTFTIDHDYENVMKVHFKSENDGGKQVDGYIIFNPVDYGLYELMYCIKDNRLKKLHQSISSNYISTLNVFFSRKDQNPYYTPALIRIKNSWDFKDLKLKEKDHFLEFYEVMISNIELSQVTEVKNENKEISKIKPRKNPLFWKSYPSIKLTEEQEELLKKSNLKDD